MDSTIITTLGGGSGIDIARLVADLATASRAPKVARFDARARAVQSSVSAVAQARSDLESFATSLATLVAAGNLQSQPSVGDSTVLDAKAKPGARIGDFSGEIAVTQLARGQTIASAFVASATAPVGQGTLTLTVGSTPFEIAIDALNDSLTGVAAAINAARSGVAASVVNDAQGARLVLKGPSGAASAFTIASTDPALANLAFPGAMTQVQSAQNAEFTLDGLAYSRPANTIDDVVPGIALTLKKISTAGVPVALGTARAGETLKATLADFVSVFNTLKGHIGDARTATRGDQGLRSLDRQLSQLVAKALTVGTPASLADIGVKTNRDGTIALDEPIFAAAYAAAPDAVEAIFSPTRDATHNVASDPGIGGALAAINTAATAPNGPLASLATRLGKDAAALADDRTRMETRETAYKARLEKQFGGVDTRVGALKATQSYLDQQIRIWTASR